MTQARWRYVERLARGATVSFRQVQSQLEGHPNVAIVHLYATEQGTVAHLIRAGDDLRIGGLPRRNGSSCPEVFTAPNFTLGRLRDLLFHEVGAWFPAQKEWLKPKGRAKGWFQVIERVSAAVYQELFAPIDDRLQNLGIERLLIVPHRALQVLPFHAFYDPASDPGRRYLLDRFEIRYAPSATLAAISHERRRAAGGVRSLLAVEVGNPRKPLPYALYEIGAIAEHFSSEQRSLLVGDQARMAGLRPLLPRKFFHDVGHGVYQWSAPLESALILVGGDRLSVGLLFVEVLSLDSTFMTCLSACETGMTDPHDVADEYIGLSGGFLFAGSHAVISSLWPVSDLASALLMDFFYEAHLSEDAAPAAALRRAQQWLRDATVEQIRDRLSRPRPLISIRLQKQYLQEFAPDRADDQPFRHPYYWAAFQISSSLWEAEPPQNERQQQ